MIIANLHHEDVTPLDEATSYQRLLDKGRRSMNWQRDSGSPSVTSTRY
jgi:hypothetical protein